MLTPQWTLTLEEAQSVLVHAVGMAAANPVSASGLPELAVQQAELGRERFMRRYMEQPAISAIRELLAGTHAEGMVALEGGRRWSFGDRIELSVIRFEVMLALLIDGGWGGLLREDVEKGRDLIKRLADADSGLFAHHYKEALEKLALSGTADIRPGRLSQEGVFEVLESVTETDGLLALETELAQRWMKVAEDPGCLGVYVPVEDTASYSRIKLVGRVGDLDGHQAKLNVIDVAALNHRWVKDAWHQVRCSIEMMGMQPAPAETSDPRVEALSHELCRGSSAEGGWCTARSTKSSHLNYL